MIVLSEVEQIAVDAWKASEEFNTFEIAAKILVSRHHQEYLELREEVVN